MSIVPKRPLGSQGLVASAQGLGCMGMTVLTSDTNPEDQEAASLKTIATALELGVNLLDTAWIYQMPHADGKISYNEELIGKAIKIHGREKFVICTKFGFSITRQVCGKEDFLRGQLAESLARLGTDYVDLYYMHRMDPDTPIEETMAVLKTLVQEGKIRYVGLSECTPSELRRAHAVHPVTAIQMEWSLGSRDIEASVVPTARELGVAIVAYSPLCRGFLAAVNSLDGLPENRRKAFPRFQGEAYEENKRRVQRFFDLAASKGCTPSQLALAWVHAQGEDVFQAIFQRIRDHPENRKFLVEGGTGTGKSRNLTYLLRLLLCHGKTVFYGDQIGWVTAFVPTATQAAATTTTAELSTQGEASISPTGDTVTSSERAAADTPHTYRCYQVESDIFRTNRGVKSIANFKDAVYIHDPSVLPCEPPAMECVVVIAASPDIRYFENFIKQGRPPLKYQINMFTWEEVVEFFAILRPPGALRSEPAPAGYTGAVIQTPAGPVRVSQMESWLGEEHLRCGYYEVGGAVRYLTNWYALLNRIKERDSAISCLTNFEQFAAVLQIPQLATVPPHVRNILAYRNVLDPHANNSMYNMTGTEVCAVSEGTWQRLCRVHYERIYAYTMKKSTGSVADIGEASYYFGLLVRTALTEVPVLVTRDVSAASASDVSSPQKRSDFNYALRLDRGATVPVSATTFAGTIAALPVGDSGLDPEPAGKVSGAAKRARQENAFTAPREVTRTLYYTTPDSALLHSFDQRNRGYQCTLSNQREIQYTPMMHLLQRTGCNTPGNPFHLFLAVPQEKYHDWIHQQAVVRTEAGAAALTADELETFHAQVHQYVIRIPVKLM